MTLNRKTLDRLVAEGRATITGLVRDSRTDELLVAADDHAECCVLHAEATDAEVAASYAAKTTPGVLFS